MDVCRIDIADELGGLALIQRGELSIVGNRHRLGAL